MNYPSYGNPYPQNYPQPRQNYAQQPQQSGILWVQGEEAAKAYMVAAGNSVLLMDSEQRVFYLKSTDQSGMPLPLRVFDYTERAVTPPVGVPAAQIYAGEFVTRKEFEALAAQISSLSGKEDASNG